MNYKYKFLGVIMAVLSMQTANASIIEVTASSEHADNGANNAVDNISSNRWESAHSDNQWLQFKLDEVIQIQSIEIDWEASRAKEFDIEVSQDGKKWETVFVEKNGGASKVAIKEVGDHDAIVLEKSVEAQFVKINCYKRVTEWGFSIFEIYINGKALSPEPHLVGREKYKDAPFMDATLSVKERISDLLSKMTLDEKINYLGGTGFIDQKKIGETQPLYRLGLPAFKMTDATLGSKLTEDHILFPTFVGLAATFNTELSAEFGRAVAEQSKADGYRILLGPGVNLYRVPNSGRNFEYLGEDPHLTSEMVVPYIKAVQDAGVMATVKHFVANNSEHFRKQSNTVVSERALREIYYPPFKAAIQKAGVKAVMTGYNLVNGEWAGQHKHQINHILRDEWGFKDLVMTDWWAIYDAEKAILSGLDLEMPAADIMNYKAIKALLDKGVITETFLEEKVANILRPLCELGLFDEEQDDPALRDNWDKHIEVAKESARQAIVLLKNDDSILPLRADKVKTVALVGKNAHITSPCGGGAGGFDPGEKLVRYDAAIKALGSEKGVDVEYYEKPTDAVKDADVALVFLTMLEHEFMDRPFGFAQEQLEMIQKTKELNANTVVIISLGSGTEMAPWIDDVKGIVYSWFPGTYGAESLAEMLFGDVNPSGKLPFTIERAAKDAHYSGNFIKEDTEKLPRTFQGWEREVPVFDMKYDEGIFTGYRWYDTKNIKPLFPFGFGLSYTSFKLGNISLSSDKMSADNTLTVKCSVTNTGDVDGAEVVQLYVQDVQASVSRPTKELKGFARVELKAGETKTVELTISKEDLAFWSEKESAWTVENGIFNILIGNSSAAIQLSESFMYTN